MRSDNLSDKRSDKRSDRGPALRSLRCALAPSFVAICIMAGAAGCTDVSDPTPTVAVTGAAPASLVAADDARDDLAITVEYHDGDGDLGGGTARVYDCRAEALRIDLPIPAIAPEGVIGKPISGTLELHVNDVGTIDATGVAESCRDFGVSTVGANSAVFCVVLLDAEERASTGDCTGDIALATE